MNCIRMIFTLGLLVAVSDLAICQESDLRFQGATGKLNLDKLSKLGKSHNSKVGEWLLYVSSGTAKFSVDRDKNNPETYLRTKSNGDSYFVGFELKNPLKLTSNSTLSWQWRANVLPKDGDIRKSAMLFGENKNDQAAQMLVVFEGKRILSFVWDTTAPVDTEVDEPSLVATVKSRVLESGKKNTKKWVTHKVNISSEFKRRYATETVPSLAGFAIQCNSNHTQSSSSADTRSITLSLD